MLRLRFHLGSLASPLTLDQNPIRMLTVVPAYIGLDQVASIELRPMRSIAEVVDRIGWRDVFHMTPGFVEYLLPRSESRIVIKPKIGYLAIQKHDQPVKQAAQKLSEFAVMLGHDQIRKHIAELLESNPAFRFNVDRWAKKAWHGLFAGRFDGVTQARSLGEPIGRLQASGLKNGQTGTREIRDVQTHIVNSRLKNLVLGVLCLDLLNGYFPFLADIADCLVDHGGVGLALLSFEPHVVDAQPIVFDGSQFQSVENVIEGRLRPRHQALGESEGLEEVLTHRIGFDLHGFFGRHGSVSLVGYRSGTYGTRQTAAFNPLAFSRRVPVRTIFPALDSSVTLGRAENGVRPTEKAA